MNARFRGLSPLAAAAGLVLSACAAAPMAPTDALTGAETAIARADEAHAADFAPLQMKSAREKYYQAKETATKAAKDSDRDEMQVARNLAEEAQAEADLARSKAQAAQAKAVNTEMQKSIDTIQQEATRNSGVPNQ